MINTSIDTGGEVAIHLQEAVLVYSSDNYGNQRRYLEVRPIVKGAGGLLDYGPGRPADMTYFRNLLLADDAPKLTPVDTRLLAVGPDEAVWWSPAGLRSPLFAGREELSHLSGLPMAMPSLVFHATRRSLRIRAVACRSRPTARTQLCVAPLWNIYDTGWLCIGTMPIPEGPPSERIAQWEKAFWDSAFTVPHVARLCQHPEGYAAMLTELRTRTRFPKEWLVPTKERLGAWLNHK